jgi:hypothetical protein
MLGPGGTGLWIVPTSSPGFTGAIWYNLNATGAANSAMLQQFKAFTRSLGPGT